MGVFNQVINGRFSQSGYMGVFNQVIIGVAGFMSTDDSVDDSEDSV